MKFWRKLFLQVIPLGLGLLVITIGYYTTFNRFTILYECNAMRFLFGADYLIKLIAKNEYILQCITLTSGGNQPFQSLPTEYPILSLIPMLLPVVGGHQYYEALYLFLMIVIIVGIYFYLFLRHSALSARFFLLLTVLGGFSVALGRLDLVIGMLLLSMVIAVERKKYILAYVFLGVSTMMKLFPIILLLPLFFYENKVYLQTLSLRNLRGIVVYILFCCFFLLVSWIISPVGTLSPFFYALYRPFEIESISASVISLFSFTGAVKTCLISSYGSFNIAEFFNNHCGFYSNTFYNSLSTILSFTGICILISTILIGSRLLVKEKIQFRNCCLLLIMIFIATNKVFSPQYLLWIIPLVAYNYYSNKKVNGLWITTCLLTSIIYPFLLGDTKLPIPYSRNVLILAILARNILFVALTVFTSWTNSQKRYKP